MPLEPEPGQLYLTLGEAQSVDATAVRQWLNEPSKDTQTQINVTLQEILYGSNFWLALHEPRFCNLTASRSVVEHGLVPQLFSLLGNIPTYSTPGILNQHALCVLKYVVDEKVKLPPITVGTLPSLPPMRLIICTFGHDEELAQRLVSLIEAWDVSGRISEQKLRVYAYTNAQTVIPAAQDIVLKRQWTQFVFRW